MNLKITDLIGKTLEKIDVLNDEIVFTTSDKEVYKMLHEQDCCEDVKIDDINGDIQDLIGSPIILAEETTNEGDTEYGSETWTFYKLATVEGYVDIKWHGESNGYYSENVDFIRVDK